MFDLEQAIRERYKRGCEDAVYYGTKLRGSTNAKAKMTINFVPRRLRWLDTGR